MIAGFIKAVGQLPDPAFRRVLVRGLGITLAVFAVLMLAGPLLLSQLAITGIEWLDGVLRLAAEFALLVVLFLVFPAMATLFISFFLDDIVDAVDARHYPHDPRAGRPALGQSLLVAARFAGMLLLANLLALPLYLLMFFLPPINLFIFYGLNGYLLGREYFELVALRHLDAASAGRLRRANRGRLNLGGVVIALLLTVPIVNIIAPIVAAAFMEHVFKGLSAGREV